jgi:hypothetical protein
MAIIGMDIHRSFAQVAFLCEGQINQEQRVDLIHDRLVKFAKTLSKEDEVVLEATGNSAAVERILRPFIKRVVIANSRMVRAIAYARVNDDERTIRYDGGPIGGWGSLRGIASVFAKEWDTPAALDTLRRQNKPHGFVSCSWAKPADYHTFEICRERTEKDMLRRLP